MAQGLSNNGIHCTQGACQRGPRRNTLPAFANTMVSGPGRLASWITGRRTVQVEQTTAAKPGSAAATLAGGCFWCLEAVFELLQGVERVESGYAGGSAPDPTYRDVCSGRTGHAEVVQVTFDPAVVSYQDVLDVFFAVHDPTTLNRQGPDVGTQYRSAVFYHSPAQKQTAERRIAELNAQQIW